MRGLSLMGIPAHANPLSDAPHLFDPEIRALYQDRAYMVSDPINLQLTVLLRQWLAHVKKGCRIDISGTSYQLQCLKMTQGGEMITAPCGEATHILMNDQPGRND